MAIDCHCHSHTVAHSYSHHDAKRKHAMLGRTPARRQGSSEGEKNTGHAVVTFQRAWM